MALMQAMLGNISSNVRVITLIHEDSMWKIEFYIQSESESDRENAEEIAEEFAVNIENVSDTISSSAYSRVNYRIIVTEDNIEFMQSANRRIIYARQEELNVVDDNLGNPTPD